MRPQADGDTVRITLERTEPIARVELDLAGPATVYPRRLRVSVSDGDGPEETVWEGGTAGAALLAAYYDYRRVPLTISLPAGTTARRVVLTSTGSDPSEPWSMAEIRVIGPDAPTSPQP